MKIYNRIKYALGLSCSNCNTSVFGKSGILFKVNRIKDTRIIKGSISDRPPFNGFDVGFSEVNNYNITGNFYYYRVKGEIFSVKLCSYKCAYEYSVENNAIMMFEDPESRGKIRCITPQIVELNRNIGSTNLYRGQPMPNKSSW